MRAQYFEDVVRNGVELARQMALIVESQHDAVRSDSYRAAKEALSSRVDAEAARLMARVQLERAGLGGGDSAGSRHGTPGGGAAGGAAGED